MIFAFSLNWALRSEAHFELAKIEEDIEQLDSAKANLLKVDYSLFCLLIVEFYTGSTIR